MASIAILGTGMAAFGAWHRLREEPHDVVLFEKNAYYGGHTCSWTFPPGFTFDHGPHVSFTKNERVREILSDNVAGKFEEVQYAVNNYWRGHWIPHPAQNHLYGLPVDVVTRVIADYVDQMRKPEAPPENYWDWLVASYGHAFAEEFPGLYTAKYHTTRAENLTTDWIGPRMYRPSLEEVLRGALAPGAPNVHYVTGFRYPSRGGFVSYLDRWASAAPIELDHEAVEIDPVARAVRFRNGRTAGYDRVLSSVPLPELVRIVRGAPEDVREAADSLACSGCVLVNVGVRRADISDAHITYFYDPEIVFSRISFPYLMSPHNAPPGMSSLQAEVYYSPKYKPLGGAPDESVEAVLGDLLRTGVLSHRSEIVYTGTMLCEYANVIFDHDRVAALDRVHGFLRGVGIEWCGRYGEWDYLWTDDSFMSGEQAAERVLSGIASRRPTSARD